MPECRVVVLSGLLTESLIERALTAGAWGYISKGEPSSEILEAVRRVADHRVVLGPEVRMVYGPTPNVAGPRNR